jgi:hypothetical protein
MSIEAEAPVLRLGIVGIFMFILPYLNVILSIEIGDSISFSHFSSIAAWASAGNPNIV